ncbi:hypothetical protein D910_07698 [Dendroctonus ponderosae]|uniref:C2H2-type domain-containing protein n=1 Tax=Dendroctonus ponderosae TaxID=77166 RepID=U4U8Y3_DENPD|nr:hypothetical protein D910_07698 [Dendroctonus ponderosae]
MPWKANIDRWKMKNRKIQAIQNNTGSKTRANVAHDLADKVKLKNLLPKADSLDAKGKRHIAASNLKTVAHSNYVKNPKNYAQTVDDESIGSNTRGAESGISNLPNRPKPKIVDSVSTVPANIAILQTKDSSAFQERSNEYPDSNEITVDYCVENELEPVMISGSEDELNMTSSSESADSKDENNSENSNDKVANETTPSNSKVMSIPRVEGYKHVISLDEYRLKRASTSLASIDTRSDSNSPVSDPQSFFEQPGKEKQDECSAAPKVSLLSRRKSENVCEICGIKFFYKSALMRHKAHQHNLL